MMNARSPTFPLFGKISSEIPLSFSGSERVAKLSDSLPHSPPRRPRQTGPALASTSTLERGLRSRRIESGHALPLPRCASPAQQRARSAALLTKSLQVLRREAHLQIKLTPTTNGLLSWTRTIEGGHSRIDRTKNGSDRCYGADVAEIDHASHQRDAERHRLSGQVGSMCLLRHTRKQLFVSYRLPKKNICEAWAARPFGYTALREGTHATRVSR